MVDCLELEILLLGNHKQRPTEKEEEIRSQQRLFHHRMRNTAILQSLRDHVQNSLEVGTYYHCVRDHNQKDIISSVPSSDFTCSQLADLCLHTDASVNTLSESRTQGHFQQHLVQREPNIKIYDKVLTFFSYPGEERKTMVHFFFYLIILL